MDTPKKSLHVTIVGGGFGGVRAALKLAKDPTTSITLISDRDEFQYYPTLYSSATGHRHLESWIPLGEIFVNHPNVHVFIDTVTSINAQKKQLGSTSGAVYDYEVVVFAIGVVTSYFGIPGLETYAYGIKSEPEIKRLKQRLFIDIAERHQVDKNYVIIGAGPTGVELAAAMGTYINRLCAHYGVRRHHVRIRLIEAEPRVLPRSSEMTSRRVAKRLRSLGVKVETNKCVEKENAAELIVSGDAVESHTVIWTSGVSNHPFFTNNPDTFKLTPKGRVEVDVYLRASEHIYVIGDNAATTYTGLAQTALHNADFVARTIRAVYEGAPTTIYHPRLPVQAIPVGRNWAVIEWRFIRIYGWIGAVIRRFADLRGYTELLPVNTALSAWRAANTYEDDYFAPTIKRNVR
ncbi:MAG: FAD-dependent oxidoreductase [Candidatus Saccharimonas sp.]